MAMMQASLGASKVVILVGAGLMGSVLIKNNKLMDFVGDISKVFSKYLKEDGQRSDGGSNESSALAQQVQRLTKELYNLSSTSRTVTVVQSGGSGGGVSITSLILPAAVVGTISYGYMRWRGLSVGDFMYVTRKGMNNAVAGVGKQLEHVSAALSSTRKHMNQRLDTVNNKLDESVVITALIRDQVEEVKGSVGRSIYEIENVNMKMEGLGLKIGEVQESQQIATQGIFLLVQWVKQLNLVAPTQNPELAQNFNSWYLKASKLDKSGLIAPPQGLKDFFTQSLEPAPAPDSSSFNARDSNSRPAGGLNDFFTQSLEPAPAPDSSSFNARDSNSRPAGGLNLPSPGGLSMQHSTPARTQSASMVTRRWSSGVPNFAGIAGLS